jgi:hypothetical protein
MSGLKICRMADVGAVRMPAVQCRDPGTLSGCATCRLISGVRFMFAQRNLRAVGYDVVNEAYDISFDYLRMAGALPQMFGVNELLLDIVVGLYHHGEQNKIRLANKAITAYENACRID